MEYFHILPCELRIYFKIDFAQTRGDCGRTKQDDLAEFYFVCLVLMKCVDDLMRQLSLFGKREAGIQRVSDVFFCLARKTGVRIFPFLEICLVYLFDLTLRGLVKLCRHTSPRWIGWSPLEVQNIETARARAFWLACQLQISTRQYIDVFNITSTRLFLHTCW